MVSADGFDLQRIQKIRKLALLFGLSAALILTVITSSFVVHISHAGLEDLGVALIIVCIVGRAWCSLYIGGRKKAEIVDRGPYSISRNPLYIFSFMGAFGVGAQTGVFSLALLYLLIAVLVFHLTIKREEAWLAASFGQTYADYRQRTPRYGPDFSKWRDDEVLDVRPRFFLITLRDGMIFLLAIPLFSAIEALQQSGWIGTLLRLP